MMLGQRTPWLVPVRVVAWAAVFVMFGQLLPRAIGRRWPVPVATLLAPLIAALLDLATPVRWIVTPLVAPVRRRVHRPAGDGDALAAVLREGELEGVWRKDELALISGVVQFADRTVGEVMTPRADIFAIDAATPPAEAAERIAVAAYSRVPVYRGTLDDITGMILAFDVLKGDGDALPAVRPVAEAQVGDRCKTLLSRMLAARRHFAVVRGADGTVAGIVTLEDLIEELVGEIRDEHDEPPARPGGSAGD
ncbi:MAG: CBS domain-containing protein [Gemmatimonadetes bacterium]|nr:CBS domain-containing protein [Gemmatimonadota bacterium]